MSIEEEQEILSRQLGAKYKPSKKWYNTTKNRIDHLFTKGYLKNSLEIKGNENLIGNYFQLFASNHILFKDPFLVQEAIALASNNCTPIPTPGHKEYLFSPIIGMGMQKLFSIPIFSKKDGYIEGLPKTQENTKREKSLDYIANCLLEHGRVLIFPEGHLLHTGKIDKGGFGTADISWRVYNSLEENSYLRKGKEGLHIIPLNISYYPLEIFRNKNQGSKITVRFGESIDFEKEFINKFNSYKKEFENNESREIIKQELKINFMDNLMKKIGSLMTINMDQIGSRILYNLTKKGYPYINRKSAKEKLEKLVNALKTTDLYLLDHFYDENLMEQAFENFLIRTEKKGCIQKDNKNIYLNKDKILFKPNDEKKIRHSRLLFFQIDTNRILFNHNNLEHLEQYKNIEKVVLSD